MAFTFQPYSSPLTNSIAERIGQAGAIEAQRAYATGNAAANAALQSGNAWSGAIQGVGQAIGALPGQIQALKASEQNQAIRNQQLQAGAMQLGAAQRQQQGEQAVANMLQGDTLPAGQEGPRQPSYLDDNNLFDVPKITARLSAIGYGDQAPALVKGAESINESIANAQAQKQKAAQQHTILFGHLANGALQLAKSGTPIDQAMDFVVQPAVASGLVDPKDYARVKTQIGTLPPEQQTAALTTMMDAAAALAPTTTDKEGDIRHDVFGRVVSKGGEKPPTEAELALKAAAGDATATGAMKLLKPAPARTNEQDDQRYRDIVARGQQQQPVSPEDAAWALGYEKQKTLGVDKSASAAAERLASSQGQQNKIQQNAQNFTQLQTARADIRENVDKPYAIAQSGADTLRDTVHAAMAGNKIAGSLQTLEATMGALRSQGFNRINTAEIGATGNAGSLWDNINSYIGKKAEGQPIPANIQKDMLAFADILDQAAAKKYVASHDAANKLYGTNIPRTYTVPTGGAAPGAGAGPDLSGLTAGHGRTFNAGPYAGQTWTIGPDGKPKQVS